ncbi:conserved exported hypothetical protein [Tenacibaculum sp. 190524A05c]|uniref:hypothetical protein n=1 Tax=Tenacibaculum platacis TaxID=3137852 RepID=UPI0031FB0C3B
MKFFKLLSLPLLLITLTKCASYKLENTAPFDVKSATSVSRTGGMPGSPGGTEIKIVYFSDKKIKFDSMFYNNKKAKTRTFTENKMNVVSAIFYSTSASNDTQMHNDASKEYGNSAPAKKEDTPFALKENEVVISYIEGKKTKYFKIGNVKTGKPVMMQ